MPDSDAADLDRSMTWIAGLVGHLWRSDGKQPKTITPTASPNHGDVIQGLKKIVPIAARNATTYQAFQNDFVRVCRSQHVDVDEYLRKSLAVDVNHLIEQLHTLTAAINKLGVAEDAEAVWLGDDSGFPSATLAIARPASRVIKAPTKSIQDTFVKLALEEALPDISLRYDVVAHPGSWSRLGEQRSMAKTRITIVDARHPVFDPESPRVLCYNWARVVCNGDILIVWDAIPSPGKPAVHESPLFPGAQLGTLEGQYLRLTMIGKPKLTVERPIAAQPQSPNPKRFEGLRVAVVGSNLCGLTAAHQLRLQGAETLIVEREKSVGKTCRTLTMGPCRIDLGEHLFPTHIPEATSFWHQILSDEFRPLYYNVALLTSAGLTPPISNARAIEFFFGSKAYNQYMRDLSEAEDQAVAVPENWVVARELLLANGRWYFDTIVGSYHLRRQNRSWSEISRENVSVHLDRLTQHNRDWHLDWSKYPQDLKERVSFAATTTSAVARSVEYSWNLQNYSSDDAELLFQGTYYPRKGCGHMSDAIHEAYQAAGA